ncbi:MAG: ferredoxin family protein [Bryobacteraceae bacterium]
MAHVITDGCLKDAACIDSCPSDAIHPLPGDADFDSAPQLFINWELCMDCGGCAIVCPAGAIYPAGDLPQDKADAARLNYIHFLADE